MCQHILIKAIVKELTRGQHLIESIDDVIFVRANIGAHFRHNLNFIDIFLNGLADDKIDYNNRIRDERIEQNRAFAIEKMKISVGELQKLTVESLENEVFVRSEVEESLWHKSSAMRELDFLHSHLVHHHALIAEKLNHYGIKLTQDFGVAPSTLKYWAKNKAAINK